MQLPETFQVKSKANKEWGRLLTMTGNFSIIGKAKCSQEIVTFLHRVAWIVPKDGKLWPFHIERSEVWLFIYFPRDLWTLALPPPCFGVALAAVPDLQWPPEIRPWTTKEATPQPHASCTHLWSGWEKKQEKKHTLLLSQSPGPGCLPATCFETLLWALDLCLASMEDIHLTTQLGLCWA